MRHQRAFRRSGRAARVDEQRRIGRARRDRREMPRCADCSDVPATRCPARVAPAHADDMRERGTLVADRQQVRQRLRIDERDLRRAVAAAGIRAPRDRTGTTAARRSRPAGRRQGARRPSPAAAAGSARPCRRADAGVGERIRQPIRLLLQDPRR